MSKKYYWLKLKDDFFRSKEMKKLRTIAGGDTFTIIYLKMQLLSIKHDGVIQYEGIEDNVASELALELDEHEDNVKMTLVFLEKHGLLEQIADDRYLMPKVFIGSEVESAERMRRLREKKKELASHCDVNVLESNTEIEIEKEIDKERDIEKEQQQTDVVVDVFKLYQSEVGVLSPMISDRLNDWVNVLGDEMVAYAIELSVRANVRRLAYIEAILKTWNDKSIKTVADAMAIDMQAKQPKQTHQKPKVEYVQNVQNQVSNDDYLAILRKHGLGVANA